MSGAISKRISTRIYLLIAMALSSGSCLLVPMAASNFGSKGVMVCRIFQGISQGGFYPSVYGLLGKWTPLNERSRLGAIALGGKENYCFHLFTF